MDLPKQETCNGSPATTTEVVGFSALFAGSDSRNLAPNIQMLIALLIDSRSEGTRSVGWFGRIEGGRL